MSLFSSPIRPPAVVNDDAVERYVAAIRAELDPDPLFRRRLRGRILNRFVAAREELVTPSSGRRMGRLGRAVLYASFTLMLGVSTAMAGSQGALPGDPLYALKRQIEELRLRALPAEYHDELIASSLTERLAEVTRLADLGRWDAVASHANAVEAEFAALRATVDVSSAPMERHLLVMGELLERLPTRAKMALADVIEDVAQAKAVGAAGRGEGTPGGPRAGGADRPHPHGGSGATSDDPDPSQGAHPDRRGGGRSADDAEGASPRPTKSPREDPRATPSPTRSP